MPEISADLAAFATAELRKRGIEVRTSTTVERISADSAELSDGELVPCRTVAWTAGVRPAPVVAQLGLPLDGQGGSWSTASARSRGARDVWAIGDAAAVPDPARPGRPTPPTCQHALRQGRTVGGNVAAALGGGRPKPFTYKTLGVFVDMGHQKAVAETVGIKWRGFPAWFLARTLPHDHDAGAQAAAAAGGRLDRRPRVRARRLGARAARAPAGARRAGHGRRRRPRRRRPAERGGRRARAGLRGPARVLELARRRRARQPRGRRGGAAHRGDRRTPRSLH